MEYTLTHQNCRKPSRGGPTWSRRQTLVNTNGPRRQTHVRAKGQKRAHRTLGTQRSRPRAHGGLTVRSSRGVSTPPRNAYRARQCCAGRNREDPRNRALAAARNGPKSTPAAGKPGAVGLSRASQASSWRGPTWENPGGEIPRETQLQVGAKICSWRWVRVLTAQKPTERRGWWKGRFACFQRLVTKGRGRRTAVQRPAPSSPCWQAVGKSSYRWRERLCADTVQSAWQSSWNRSPVIWPVSFWLC